MMESIAPQSIPRPWASAGTVLIREWGGVRHRVTVLDHDVAYQGRRHKSLSEAGRAITGSRWSGPGLPDPPLSVLCICNTRGIILTAQVEL